MCPMSMSAPTFHASAVKRLARPPFPPLASETRVVPADALETELAIDARLRELPRAHDDFVLVREAGVLVSPCMDSHKAHGR